MSDDNIGNSDGLENLVEGEASQGSTFAGRVTSGISNYARNVVSRINNSVGATTEYVRRKAREATALALAGISAFGGALATAPQVINNVSTTAAHYGPAVPGAVRTTVATLLASAATAACGHTEGSYGGGDPENDNTNPIGDGNTDPGDDPMGPPKFDSISTILGEQFRYGAYGGSGDVDQRYVTEGFIEAIYRVDDDGNENPFGDHAIIYVSDPMDPDKICKFVATDLHKYITNTHIWEALKANVRGETDELTLTTLRGIVDIFDGNPGGLDLPGGPDAEYGGLVRLDAAAVLPPTMNQADSEYPLSGPSSPFHGNQLEED